MIDLAPFIGKPDEVTKVVFTKCDVPGTYAEMVF
jgi:hypothetical protein